MANNYLQFSECICIEAEEFEWAEKYLGILDEFYGLEDAEAEAHPDYKLYRSVLDTFEIDMDAESFDFEWDIENRKKNSALLCIFSEESGNLENAALFIQQFLRKFRPDGYVSLTWAATCSKMRAGEFGGGAAFITAENIEFMDSYSWVDKQIAEFKEKK